MTAKMWPNDSSFSHYKYYVDICGGSVEKGRQTTVGCGPSMLSDAESAEPWEIRLTIVT